MNKDIAAELERIREKHPDGKLSPYDVVAEARKKTSPLHDCFEWDDTEAAKAYRLYQARQLITMSVTVIEPDSKPVRVYVSLFADRKEGSGYRYVPDVLANGALRARMLEEAWVYFKSFERKYRTLKELDPLFDTADRLRSG